MPKIRVVASFFNVARENLALEKMQETRGHGEFIGERYRSRRKI